MVVPELLKFSTGSQAKLGVARVADEPPTQFGRNCLLARRLVGRGVRFAEIVHASTDHYPEFKQGTEKESLGRAIWPLPSWRILSSVAFSTRL